MVSAHIFGLVEAGVKVEKGQVDDAVEELPTTLFSCFG
jgi:hypothetical protein